MKIGKKFERNFENSSLTINNNLNYFNGFNFLLLFFELFDGLDVIIDVRFQKNLCYQSIFNYL